MSKRTISPEHLEKLQAGREAKRQERNRSRAARVNTYRDWNRRDAERWREYQQGNLTRAQWVSASQQDPMPETPSDDDFKIVDGRMTEKEEAA